MTFVNWISIGITAVLVIAGIALNVYYRKKLHDLDGFMGISTPSLPEEEE